MIDPSTGTVLDVLANDTGFNARSNSLEIIVDAIGPQVNFGLANVVADGLKLGSDTGVAGVLGTFVDNITSDTTPTFWGNAEANSIVRLYVDVNGNGIDGADVIIGQTVAIPADGTNQLPLGQWELTSDFDMNDPVRFGTLGFDGARRIFAQAEDPAGNIGTPVLLTIFVDSQGPQVNDPDGAGPLQAIQIANATPQGTPNAFNGFNLFTGKPFNAAAGPTPIVDGLIINIRDLPARVAPFIYNAIQNPTGAPPIITPVAPIAPGSVPGPRPNLAVPAGAVALNPDYFSMIGDATGSALILSAYFVPTTPPIPPSVPATGYIVLTFRNNTGAGTPFVGPYIGASLPDDRFTLTVKDDIVDPAGNRLDGENNGVNARSGDTRPGGRFVARLTVDSRAEIGVWSSGNVWADTNGNFSFDPDNVDALNRDITYAGIGFASDNAFAGNFLTLAAVPPGGPNGFDKVGVYGRVSGGFRWDLDTNDDGVLDTVNTSPNGINGLPAAGNFDLDPEDELVVFDGNTWFFYNVVANGGTATIARSSVNSVLNGLPMVGDFDGDGLTDLGTYNEFLNQFEFDLTTLGGLGGASGPEFVVAFGFPGVREQPVAADFDADGIDDFGLFSPDRTGPTPESTAEWSLFISAGLAVNARTPGFSPTPLGPDIHAQFGDQFTLPLVGNFDPPVTRASTSEAPMTNVAIPLDVNNDQVIAPIDALLVINVIGMTADQSPPTLPDGTPFYPDVDGDHEVTPLDALLVINELNSASTAMRAPLSGVATSSSSEEHPVGTVPSERQDNDRGWAMLPPRSSAAEIGHFVQRGARDVKEPMESLLETLALDVLSIWSGDVIRKE